MKYADEEDLKLFRGKGMYADDVDAAIDHAHLVANLSYLLAKKLGCGEEYCEFIFRAGIFHDIGKLRLGELLYGRTVNVLRIEEMRYVRMHPSEGRNILLEAGNVPEELIETVYRHHENYDGSGYPGNIKGDEIPFGARIIRVVDVFAALSSNRMYRKAYSDEKVMQIMVQEHKNYDMKIFLKFIELIHSEEYIEIKSFINEANARYREKPAVMK